MNSRAFGVNVGCWIISAGSDAKSLCAFSIPCVWGLILNVILICTFVTFRS